MLRLMSALGVDEEEGTSSSEAESEQEAVGPMANGAQVSS